MEAGGGSGGERRMLKRAINNWEGRKGGMN
jgi:hypothetical protein